MPNRKFDSQSKLAARFYIYSLFSNYYQGQWAKAHALTEAVRQYLGKSCEAAAESALAVPGAGRTAEEALMFEYNRLFVGPAKLLAPPFESVYRNAAGLVMQEETLEVRDFYRKAGLEVSGKNTMPDDHLGLELEFICYLLAKAGLKTEAGETHAADSYLEVYRDFFAAHIQTWVYRHCDDVVQKGQSPVCRQVAEALADFLRSEEAEFVSREGAG